MFDFDHLSPIKTAKLKLPAIFSWPKGSPHRIELELRHGGDGTPEFLSERLKRAGRLEAAKEKAEKYAHVANLWADTLVAGWEGVHDAQGKPLPYTKELGRQLFAAIIRAKRFDVIDWISEFVSEADNFHDPIAVAEDLGKD